MTLKEKFKDVIDDAITYQQQEDSFVQIAEEFAIEFGQWLLNQPYRVKYNDKKELLEIYKKTL